MNILVTLPVELHEEKMLRDAAPGCDFRFRSVDGVPLDPRLGFGPLTEAPLLTQEDMAWANVVLGNVKAASLGQTTDLRWYQTGSAGVEDYVRPGVMPQGAALTNATGAYGLAISEYMLASLLCLMKKLELYRDAQKEASWRSQGGVDSVYGANVLVLGTGDIGGEFARRCKALGARVVGVRRRQGDCPDYLDELHTIEDLDALLPQADVVAITLPGTPATRGLFDGRRIGLMKRGAYLLNVGRGYIVDSGALCDALESGRLAGAGLDVTDPEPLPPDHPLWRVPTALITPHTSGYYHLKETHWRIVQIFVENLKRFLSGGELLNQVDFASGYKR